MLKVRPVSYFAGRAFVYCKIKDEHHVANNHWEEYLSRRREVPRLCVIHDTLDELRRDLLKKGVLV